MPSSVLDGNETMVNKIIMVLQFHVTNTVTEK